MTVNRDAHSDHLHGDRSTLTGVRGATGGPESSRDLVDALGAAILATAVGDGESPDHLVLVAHAADAHAATRDLLAQTVAAARRDGHSWARIGAVLGLSRQAVQQRFGGDPPAESQPDVRWLGPVTAVDEMAELALAGRRGWHTVEAGLLTHKMVRTDTQWEHRRVLWARPAGGYATDGWRVAARAFPWLYLVRDLGIPAVD